MVVVVEVIDEPLPNAYPLSPPLIGWIGLDWIGLNCVVATNSIEEKAP